MISIYGRPSIWMFYFIQILVSFYVYKKSDKIKVGVLLAQVISVALFFGLRGNDVGTDTINYVTSFMNNDQGLDLGLKILNTFVSVIFGKNTSAYLLFISFVFSVNIAQILFHVLEDKKYINFAFLSIIFMPYVILMNVNIIRQGLSITFMLLGLILVMQKSKWYGWIYVLAGALLHYSMSVFLIIYIIIRYLKLNSMIVILVFLFLIAFNMSGLSLFLVRLIPFDYIRIRFLHYLSMKSGISFLLKLVFYFVNFYLFRMFTIVNETKMNKQFLDFFGAIIISASILINSELSASRILINSEVIIPTFLIMQIGLVKERRIYLILLLFLNFLYFLSFTLSNSYAINFLII